MLDDQTDMQARLFILLAHPHALIRDAVAQVLAEVRDFQVDSVGDLPELEARLSGAGRIDVVLLDTEITAASPISTVQRMAQITRGGAVIALAGADETVLVPMLLEAGARGVIPKTMSMRSVPNAIRLVHSGEIFVPIEVHRNKSTNGSSATVSEEMSTVETAILRRIAKGLKNKEIAWELNLRDVNVKMHVRNICRKVGAKNRTHAVVIARQRGMV